MSRKKREKEELLAPDPFMAKAEQTTAWVQQNLKWILGGLVLVLGGIGAAKAMTAGSAREASVMTLELNEAIEAFQEAVDFRTVITSTSAEAVTAGYRDAKKRFGEFRAGHAGRDAARLAALYEAELARRLDEHEAASGLYETYIAGAPADDPLLFVALEGAGYSLEGAGKLAEALAKYVLLEERQPFMRDYAKKHQARVLETQGQIADALEIYRAIATRDPPSPLKHFAEGRVRALE